MSASEAAANQEYQQDEMIALGSILDSSTFIIYASANTSSSEDQQQAVTSGSLVIHVNAPTIGITILKDNESFLVKYLPPITLHFTLPQNYPLESKPSFTLSSYWLDRPKLSKLCQKLDSLWVENKELNGILFLWYTFLKEDTFKELGEDRYDISWWKSLHHQRSSTPSSSTSGQSCEASSNKKHQKSNNSSTVTVTAEDKCNNSDDKDGLECNDIVSSSNAAMKKTELLDSRAVLEYKQMPSLFNHLKAYNEEQVDTEFTFFSHPCLVCFQETIGSDCFKFPVCAHIYCKDCIKVYFQTLINDGQVDSLRCPSFECKSAPTPGQILSLVGPELYERYDRLLLQRTLDSMPDVLYCPRRRCHQHVLYDPEDKLATCPSCAYTFCAVCKMVYHGVEPCRFKGTDKQNIFTKYTTGTAEEKKQLEKKYGKKQLAVLVESVLSEQWVSKKAKPCPHCSAPIEKFEGCNKVTCYKCNTYFCWICLKQLNSADPYLHFNDPSSPCFNTLFEGAFGEDNDESDEDDDEFLDVSDSDDEDEVW